MSREVPSTHKPGQILDRKYELRSCLGRGASGSVFLARHIYMDREVAIKLLHPSFVADEKRRARFFREAKLTSKLRHPNIVTVYEFGLDGDVPYLVMEYVPGSTLRSLLREKGMLDESEVTAIAFQIGRALAAAHKRGIVHRDLKPDNIILTGGNNSHQIKILDFGVAKLFDRGDLPPNGTFVTEFGAVQGTPKYAAPEQLRGETVNARADVYSFGVVLYEALAGVPPFEGSSLIEYAARHMSAPVVPLREKNPAVQCSEKLEKLIMACLAKKPAERPSNGTGLLIELLRLGPDEPIEVSRKPWLRSSPAALIAGVGLLLLFGVFLPGHAGRQESPAVALPLPEAETQPQSAPEEDLDALFQQGQIAYNNAQYSDAAAIFRHVFMKRPDDDSTIVYLALTLRRLERFDEATETLKSVNTALLDPSLLTLLNTEINEKVSAPAALVASTNSTPALQATIIPASQSEPRPQRVAKPVPCPVQPRRHPDDEKSGSAVERGFGNVLEFMNRGMRVLF